MTDRRVRQPLRHPLLQKAGVEHGFGTRDSTLAVTARVARARQVHGSQVAIADGSGQVHPAEADAVVSWHPGVAAAVVTADCVPILACTADGRAVAAIHAGWRGLAAGVIEAGLEALRRQVAERPGCADSTESTGYESRSAVARESVDLRAVVGPHIGACCYEVDAAVLTPLRARFGDQLDDAIDASRPGHALLDLASLTRVDLVRAGVASTHLGMLPDACTRCDSARFHSYRRDGARAGRLLHYAAPRAGAEA